MSNSKKSNRWLARHLADPYVKDSKRKGYRSRAVYKLSFIQEKDKILRAGMTVVDLGAAPGSWSQFVAEKVGESGHIFSIDILPMKSIPNVEFIQGDFTEQSTKDKLLALIGGDRVVDLVISDMAPNMSGIMDIDQSRVLYLAELALDVATDLLKPGGSFVVKVFQGTGIDEFMAALKASFKKVVVRKPAASRAESRELYLVAKGFKA